MKEYVIALDLGGTNSVLGLVDKEGKIQKRTTFKTTSHPTIESYTEQCAESVRLLISHAGSKEAVKALGIGAPDVNYWSQTIENATNLPWKGVIPLASLLKAKLDMPVCMTNDAKAAALGEMQYGAARGMKDFIMLTLGTGVGSGIVVDGRPVYGKRSFAGELGHTAIRPENGRKCPCGRTGCVEAYCSATGVVQTARELLRQSPEESLLRRIDPEKLTSKDICEAALRGDKPARQVFEYTGRLLGEACANFAAFSDPEAFILFGGLSKAGDLLMKPLANTYRQTVFDNYKGTARFLLSALDDADAALLGAAALAWTKSVQPPIQNAVKDGAVST